MNFLLAPPGAPQALLADLEFPVVYAFHCKIDIQCFLVQGWDKGVFGFLTRQPVI